MAKTSRGGLQAPGARSPGDATGSVKQTKEHSINTKYLFHDQTNNHVSLKLTLSISITLTYFIGNSLSQGAY